MCLILFAVEQSPTYPLVVAANRDEQHARATLAADYWQDNPDILGGRDLVAGGTWLGLSRSGRFAAVTNFAEPAPDPIPPRSRGELTADFLAGDMDCETYLTGITKKAAEYRGFNLLISDGSSVWYYSNQNVSFQPLAPGYYGLSNQLLDCDWPKVINGRSELANELQTVDENLSSRLFHMLRYEGDGSPHSAKFILGDSYGTSVSSVVLQKRDSGGEVQFWFEERGFNPTGEQTRSQVFELMKSPATI